MCTENPDSPTGGSGFFVLKLIGLRVRIPEFGSGGGSSNLSSAAIRLGGGRTSVFLKFRERVRTVN